MVKTDRTRLRRGYPKRHDAIFFFGFTLFKHNLHRKSARTLGATEQRPRRRIRGANMLRVCVSADGLVTMCRSGKRAASVCIDPLVMEGSSGRESSGRGSRGSSSGALPLLGGSMGGGRRARVHQRSNRSCRYGTGKLSSGRREVGELHGADSRWRRPRRIRDSAIFFS